MKTKITITPAHAKKAKGYFDNNSCLLGTALKEKFPGAEVFCGGDFFDLNNVRVQFGEVPTSKIINSYDNDLCKPVVKKSFSFIVNIPDEAFKK